MEWVRVERGTPHFQLESGTAWTPVGQNDAIAWADPWGLYRRSDREAARRYIRMLARHVVTCLRLMLEYAETEIRGTATPRSKWIIRRSLRSAAPTGARPYCGYCAATPSIQTAD